MRIRPETVFLVCLGLWIPVAQSQNSAFVPEDEELSGDIEEFSGSGSGDSDLEDFEMTTQASANTTKMAWATDASVRLPHHTTTQVQPLLVSKAQTSHPITKAPPLHTTMPNTPSPSPTSGKTAVTAKEIFVAETSTAHNEETRSTPATTPYQSITERETSISITEDTEEETTKSVTPVEKTSVSSKDVDQLFEAPEVEATALPLSTTDAGEPSDSEASGDGPETTTVQATTEGYFTEENVIPEKVGFENSKNDADFGFENEGPKTKSGHPPSESAMSDSSKNESLLEKKEVLAGVVAGGVVGLAFAVMLVALMVYRMKKKDEGSYALDEHKHPNGGYCKPQRQEEFLA